MNLSTATIALELSKGFAGDSSDDQYIGDPCVLAASHRGEVWNGTGDSNLFDDSEFLESDLFIAVMLRSFYFVAIFSSLRFADFQMR